MLICFECSKEAKRMLDELVATDSYDDFGQAIEDALRTLHLIKREMGNEKSIVIGESKIAEQAVMVSVLDDAEGPTLFHTARERTPAGRELIPQLFQHKTIGEPSRYAEPRSDSWDNVEPVPLDRWLFAMYNKFLPVKANCRALANLQAETGGAVPLSVAQDRVGKEVLLLGDHLKRLDKQHDLKRDDALSVAFPLSKDKGDKSVIRYVSQFIGNVNKSGVLSGMLTSLKLLGGEKGRDPEISLTEAGWRFAELPNPILDVQDDGPTQRFSPLERQHLIDHIASNVPVELFAYKTLLRRISEGLDSPGDLDASLKSMLSTEGREYTDSFLSSQRSGAISRMVDLGLVMRRRQGVQVAYLVTDIGSEFLKSVEGDDEQG